MLNACSWSNPLQVWVLKALPEGVLQAAGEEKEEIQGHILLRVWDFTSLTVTSLQLPIADTQT